MGGGAWPFLVGGVICLVNSVNERDLSLLTSRVYPLFTVRSQSVRVWSSVLQLIRLAIGFGQSIPG